MALQIRGVHHITLTVSDVERSTKFYEQVFGVQAFPGDSQARCMSCGNFLLGLQRPPKQGLPNDRFDENRLGLDHLAFAVESHKQFEALGAVLAELGAPTTPISRRLNQIASTAQAWQAFHSPEVKGGEDVDLGMKFEAKSLDLASA